MEASSQIIHVSDSRNMSFLNDCSMDLVVTSPPYWHIKDYGLKKQIGYGQDLHSYLKDLFLVWKECVRVLRPGRRICINIGDQFARSSIYGRYKVIPLHAEIVSQVETLGCDFMGSVIWTKKTTMNTSGGAVVMGSYPYPPNGIIEIDYEYILIFKKPGRSAKVDREIKEASSMTKEEWKKFHSGHWYFGGARQVNHEAMFPPELPRRLIRMFTFRGENVLDPFAGSGTTLRAAHELGRNGVGLEINPRFVEIAAEKVGEDLEVRQGSSADVRYDIEDWCYTPSIANAAPPSEEHEQVDTRKVRSIDGAFSLVLKDGERVDLAGIHVTDPDAARGYLERYVKGKQVITEDAEGTDGHLIFLKNRIFVNGELVKLGCAELTEGDHPARKRLQRIMDRSRH